jgi:hypothetical protein
MIASAETTAKIADLIYRVAKWGYEQERFTLSNASDAFIKSIWGDVDEQREQRIYEALRELNRNSYETRYKELEVEPFVDCPYAYKRFERSEGFHRGENGAEEIQKLKSVQFFKYQCDEHNKSPDSVNMFKVLEELERNLAGIAISNMPEYKAAKWG